MLFPPFVPVCSSRARFLVDDKKNADAIVELRAGALSVDKDGILVGLPSINIPIPLATSPLPFPQEVALYKSQDQTGVAKFAFVAYDAKTGQLIHANDPTFGYAQKSEQTLAASSIPGRQMTAIPKIRNRTINQTAGRTSVSFWACNTGQLINVRFLRPAAGRAISSVGRAADS